jgi:hypothetical protein
VGWVALSIQPSRICADEHLADENEKPAELRLFLGLDHDYG